MRPKGTCRPKYSSAGCLGPPAPSLSFLIGTRGTVVGPAAFIRTRRKRDARFTALALGQERDAGPEG